MTGTMCELEDYRQRFFTEGTREAWLAYSIFVTLMIDEVHEQIDLDCGPNAKGCWGEMPCGGCVDCLHGQWSFAMESYRVEAGWSYFLTSW
jgi:hypothetical protein